MMKIILLPVFLLLLPSVSGAEEVVLKLRTSFNPGYTRAVLEGPQAVIDRAIVNQKEGGILVTFTGVQCSIQSENASITYRKLGSDRIVLSPGPFRGIKVMNMKNPGRLVIDIFQERQQDEKQTQSPPSADKGSGREGLSEPSGDKGETARSREEAGGFALQGKAPAGRGRILVIDPGHGGFESGIVRDDNIEKNIVMEIARKLVTISGNGSFDSSLTRSGDLFMSLPDRVKNANIRKPDIFLSLHVGNHRDMVIYMPVITESVSDTIKPYLYSKGQEAYLKKTVVLLNAMKEAAAADLGSDMVTVRPLPHSILSGIEAAALMIEMPSFEYETYSDEFKVKIANVLNRGLYLYEENEASR